MKTHLVYATTNPGKTAEVARRFAVHGIIMTPLLELVPRELRVEETGTSLGQNAHIKVNAYLAAMSSLEHLRGRRVVVAADDTGLEIDGLKGEPGIYVRRWKDRNYEMTDEELIDYAKLRTSGLTASERGAQFTAVLSVGVLEPDGTHGGASRSFRGILRGSIYEQPKAIRVKGFPFSSLFHVDEWHMCLGDSYVLPPEQKEKLVGHRERALDAAVPYIKQQLGL